MGETVGNGQPIQEEEGLGKMNESSDSKNKINESKYIVAVIVALYM